jgi:hypothetical protein
MSLSQIINVNISRQTTAVSVAGFGIPMFLAEADLGAGGTLPTGRPRIATYTDSTDVGVDWGTNSPAHLAAVAFFSQNPSIPTFKVGAYYSANTGGGADTAAVLTGGDASANVAELAGNGVGDFSITINGSDIEVSADFSGDGSVADLAATLDALPALATVNVTESAGSIVITTVATGSGASLGFAFSDDAAGTASLLGLLANSGGNIVQGFGTDGTITDAVIAIEQEDNDWYVGTCYARGVEAGQLANQKEFALAVAGLSNPKLVFTGSANQENYANGDGGTNDVASALSNNDRIVVFYHDAAIATTGGTPYAGGIENPFPECAFAGYNLPFDAGSATWAYLQLNGVSPAQNEAGTRRLNQGEHAALQAKNCNTTELVAGVTVTREGKVTSGEWIDIIRGVDNMDEDITKALFRLLVSQQGGKVPFTNSGMNQIKNVIEGQLQVYVNRGFIVNNFVVTVPDANYAGHDKANRTVNDVKFVAQLQGAVHTINVSGTVTYDVPVAA